MKTKSRPKNPLVGVSPQVTIDSEDLPMTFDEWCAESGFDPTTREYRKEED